MSSKKPASIYNSRKKEIDKVVGEINAILKAHNMKLKAVLQYTESGIIAQIVVDEIESKSDGKLKN